MIGTLVGSFRITEKLGEGGMGAVYLGVDIMLERQVAIKVLRPELTRQEALVERFRNEAVTLARLSHPAIATVYSFIRQGDDFFLVLEYVPGETLDRVLRRDGAMPWPRALGIARQALEGIEQAHQQGVVHRDLKPENIMLTPKGAVKVTDFGIARMVGSSRLTRQGQIVGTLEYMAPEQVRGEEADARTDVYAMGVVLYEMLTGKVPFSATSEFELMRAHLEVPPPRPRERVPGLPEPVEACVLRALEKDPAARYPSAAAFRDALAACPSVAPAIAEPPAVTPVRPTRLAEPAGPPPTRLAEPSRGLQEGRLSAAEPARFRGIPVSVRTVGAAAGALLVAGGIWLVLPRRAAPPVADPGPDAPAVVLIAETDPSPVPEVLPAPPAGEPAPGVAAPPTKEQPPPVVTPRPPAPRPTPRVEAPSRPAVPPADFSAPQDPQPAAEPPEAAEPIAVPPDPVVSSVAVEPSREPADSLSRLEEHFDEIDPISVRLRKASEDFRENFEEYYDDLALWSPSGPDRRMAELLRRFERDAAGFRSDLRAVADRHGLVRVSKVRALAGRVGIGLRRTRDLIGGRDARDADMSRLTAQLSGLSDLAGEIDGLARGVSMSPALAAEWADLRHQVERLAALLL